MTGRGVGVGRKKRRGPEDHPISKVLWVPVDKVVANDYNPNAVAPNELRLLRTSIAHDGFTMPIVTVFDDKRDKYIIVDGFHRSLVAKRYKDILDSTGGLLPIVVINTDPNQRMASTVRHNRARGKHSVSGMSNLVFSMLERGWTDSEICQELGMEAEEIARLKHITGFSKLFENVEYRRAWENQRQTKVRLDYERSQKNANKKAKEAE